MRSVFAFMGYIIFSPAKSSLVIACPFPLVRPFVTYYFLTDFPSNCISSFMVWVPCPIESHIKWK